MNDLLRCALGSTLAHAVSLAMACSLALLGGASATAQEKAHAVVEPSPKAPRGKLLEWKSAQGRTYWYRLPKEIDAKDPPSLVLMLHGTGLNHGWSFWNYPILGDFRRRDIVISPDGLTPGQGETFNFVQGPKDGEQITGLITEFKKRFPIGRVYLYGHSQGAFFCYWFAGEHPELVDGIVAHAGNVLDVKHSKLAKQKVAIGILHGRADAVVPVDCAIRTEKIYKEEGYEKLRLEIVDGLSEQSGHWPLPVQVAQMFEWLDQVSAQSAAQAVKVIGSELEKEAPELATIAEQLKKAKALLPKAAEADKKALAPMLGAVQTFLAKASLLHSEKLLASGEALDPKAAFGPWALQFLRGEAAFADDAEWKKRMTKPRELAKAHDKLAEKAKKALDKNTPENRTNALRALEDGFLSARAGELRSVLEMACTNATPPDDACRDKVQSLVDARKKAAAEAAKTATDLERPLLDELKAAAPGLVATDQPESDDK